MVSSEAGQPFQFEAPWASTVHPIAKIRAVTGHGNSSVNVLQVSGRVYVFNTTSGLDYTINNN